jgi:photoactive yellow protein
MSTLPPEEIDFEADDLAEVLARMNSAQRNRLPFGVVLMSHRGDVLYYSDHEREMSGYPRDPVGLNWLRDVAPCMNEDWFHEGLMRSRNIGRLDVMVSITGDHRDRRQNLDLRLLSSGNGDSMWLLIQRV